MSRAQFLLDKQKEIRDILSSAWKQEVRIFIFDDSGNVPEDCDFEIMVSLEGETYQEVIVCLTPTGTKMPAPASHTGCFGFLMSLCEKLERLLGCRIGYVDQAGLAEYYPVTYRNRFSTDRV